MSRNYHEELADVIVNEIAEAQSFGSFSRAVDEMTAISHASTVSKGKSKLKCDLKKFIKHNKSCYSYNDIDKLMKDLSERIGKQIDFSTMTLYRSIERRLIKNLQPIQDLWETAKIIYSLATLYDDNKERLAKSICLIVDKIQRRNATIVARAYFKEYEDIFDTFG